MNITQASELVRLRQNPKESISKDGYWWKPPEYPEDTIICPLCWLPETTGEYKNECHCWDAQRVGDSE